MTPNDPIAGEHTSQNDAPLIPPAPVNAHSAGHSRRTFLFKLSLLLNGAVGVVLAVPIIGYLLGPAVRKAAAANSWVPLGSLPDFPEGETRLVDFRDPITTEWDGKTGNIPCWVRRISGNKFQVFAINCAHLGCPVRWFSQSQLFLCPCHGGAYYADGSRASGPPERGLFEYDYRVVANTLMIKVGKMPTLATQQAKCAGQTLVNIDGASQLASAEPLDTQKSGCASCQG